MTSTVPRFLTASLALELGVLLALSVLVPFMVHLLPVPEDARLGPRLLPMFYTPLLAALLGRKRSAFAVALIAPWLNWLLTAHPTRIGAVITTVELLVFVVVLRLLLARGARWFLAVPAYACAMILAALVAALFPALIGGRPAGAWLMNSVTMGLPGVAVLLLINWFVVRNYPTGTDGSGPIAT